MNWDTDVKPMLAAAEREFRAQSGQWVPAAAEAVTYFEGCVPPIYGPRKIACGEAHDFDAQGRPTYLAFRNINYAANTAEAKYCTLAEIRAA